MDAAAPHGWADLTEERVVVRGRPLAVLRPRDAEALIDEERFAKDEFLPYWAELWPSARALADEVAARPLAGLRVVELGCGLGLPSLAAALAGARVLASDWAPEALLFAAANARRNGVGSGAASGAAGVLETLECDWATPEAIVVRGPFDVVLAADVLYERANVPLLVALLPRLLAPGGEALVADPGRPALAAFVEGLRAAGWLVEELPPLLRCVPPERSSPGVALAGP